MKLLENIEAVIFDMDGLIVNSEPLWQQAEKEIFASVGIYLTTEDCLKTTGLPTFAVFDHWFQVSPWDGISKKDLEDKLFERVFGLIREHATPMPGVLETLKYFSSKGLKIGLASASPLELIEIVLDKLEIKEYFQFYHSALLEKNNKPHPDVYWAVARKLGVNIENCLILEDSTNGVKGAVASGAKVVAVPDHYFFDYKEFDNATLKVKSLNELLDFIQ